MSCTVKQNESPDLLGPSSLQSPLGPSAPVARFTFAPDKPTASIPVAFDGRSSCPEGGFQGGCLSTERSITAFTWDFGAEFAIHIDDTLDGVLHFIVESLAEKCARKTEAGAFQIAG